MGAHIQQRLFCSTWSGILLTVPMPTWLLGTCCDSLQHKGNCCYLLQTRQCLLFPMACLGSQEGWSCFLAVSAVAWDMFNNSWQYLQFLHSCLTNTGSLILEALFFQHPGSCCVIVPMLWPVALLVLQFICLSYLLNHGQLIPECPVLSYDLFYILSLWWLAIYNVGSEVLWVLLFGYFVSSCM